MKDTKKHNTELTKYSESSNSHSETFGKQYNWSKQKNNNTNPDFDYSRFKKSGWERLGELIGIGIFAYILHLLMKSCFAILICLFCLPVCAQKSSRMPVAKPNINTEQINILSQKNQQHGLELKKRQQVLRGVNVSPGKDVIRQIKQRLEKQRKMREEYDIPLLPPFEDIRNREQLYDSACIYMSRADTLNYMKYLKRSVSARYPLAMYLYGISILGGVGIKSNTGIGLSYVNRASEAKCPEATCFIAKMYESGDFGYKKDSIMALNYYEKSAEQGSFNGTVAAGDRYFENSDTIRAIEFWEKAYNMKSRSLLLEKEKPVMAQIAYNLGYLMYNGICIPQNQEEGIDYIKDAAIWGHSYANYYLGLLYAEGTAYTPQNDKMSCDYIRASAKLGEVEGEALYGDYCLQGYGMEKDSDEAVYWYKQAALQNHIRAYILPFLYYNAHDNDSTILWGTREECRDSAEIQYLVGAAYYDKEDLENAETWWKKAAAQKDPYALWMMYWLYEVHKRDSVLAFDYLKQAVDAKSPDALHDMACNYANGDMVEKDVVKAKELLLEAASMGYAGAYKTLGNLYINKDYIKKPKWEIAVKYYKIGAEMNDPDAQYNYGMCLKKGKGAKKDKQAALNWLKLAAKNGSEDAITELNKMGVSFIVDQDE